MASLPISLYWVESPPTLLGHHHCYLWLFWTECTFTQIRFFDKVWYSIKKAFSTSYWYEISFIKVPDSFYNNFQRFIHHLSPYKLIWKDEGIQRWRCRRKRSSPKRLTFQLRSKLYINQLKREKWMNKNSKKIDKKYTYMLIYWQFKSSENFDSD